MTRDSSSATPRLEQIHAPLIESLCARAERAAAAFGGISRTLLVEALERSVASRFPAGESKSTVAAYLRSLHIEDLALACACSEGREPAWQYFIATFRPELYSAARAICSGNDTAARELADSLYAELFGLRGDSTERRSLFLYFHGRSRLSTWLRAILAQRRVDVLRAASRSESLDHASRTESADDSPAPLDALAAPAQEPDPDRNRYLAILQAALTTALTALPPRDRLRLSCYYLQNLTLAEIGRLLGEHEATVSRHLARIRRELRRQVELTLRNEKRLSEAQIQLCYQYATEEWPFDLSRALGAAPIEE
jgi:RNA polymerase sigma-70 factor (ECF subfamily)